MVPTPALYRLAANREYHGIPDRVATHPDDILWTDRYGSNCVHLLCQARTHAVDNGELLLRAVRAIVNQQSGVVAYPNICGWTPLHFAVECHGEEQRFACHSSTTSTSLSRQKHNRTPPSPKRTLKEASQSFHFLLDCKEQEDEDRLGRYKRREPAQQHLYMSTSAKLVFILMEACPWAVSIKTKAGFKTKTPFHIGCEIDADARILRHMLSINPKLAVQPFLSSMELYTSCSAENPLQLLWKNHHHHHSCHQFSRHRTSQSRLRPVRGNPELMDKMALLLQAAYCGTVHSRGNHNFRLLNAACSVRCPKDYIALILRQYEEEINEKDEKGLLPLHYAVRNAETSESLTYTQFMIQNLLQAYPQAAAVPDEHGRLPLHVAAEVGLTWHKGGVQELAMKYPTALQIIDPATGLVPFLLQARHAIHSRLHLSTTLELLLAAPEMVHPLKGKAARSTSRVMKDK